MNMSRAAIRYAKAILEFATDANKAAAVNEDMKSIGTTINSNQELSDFLSNPIIKQEVKNAALKEVFSSVQPETNNLFDLLLENKRFEILSTISSEYSTLFDANNGVQSATVTTAIAMTPELEQQVLAKIATFSSKKITIENTVDPSIIGGFILRIGDMQYNASVANKLQELKREFSN
ncbi:MAG: ATP synthase F1 subunit delta [Flavobacterium sp.]|nr:ATP synthase F1 subunit delta [Flavobacterium sp.]